MFKCYSLHTSINDSSDYITFAQPSTFLCWCFLLHISLFVFCSADKRHKRQTTIYCICIFQKNDWHIHEIKYSLYIYKRYLLHTSIIDYTNDITFAQSSTFQCWWFFPHISLFLLCQGGKHGLCLALNQPKPKVPSHCTSPYIH